MKVKEHYTKDHTLEDANSMPDPELPVYIGFDLANPDSEFSVKWGYDENGKLWWEYLDADQEYQKAWIEKTERELF